MQIKSHKQTGQLIVKCCFSIAAILLLFWQFSLSFDKPVLSFTYFMLSVTVFIGGVISLIFTNNIIHANYVPINSDQSYHLGKLAKNCSTTQKMINLHLIENGYIAPQTYHALVKFHTAAQELPKIDAGKIEAA